MEVQKDKSHFYTASDKLLEVCGHFFLAEDQPRQLAATIKKSKVYHYVALNLYAPCDIRGRRTAEKKTSLFL